MDCPRCASPTLAVDREPDIVFCPRCQATYPRMPAKAVKRAEKRAQGQPEALPNKYGAVRTEVDGILFDPVTLALPYPLSTNNLYLTVNGRRVLTKAARDYHKQVAWIAHSYFSQPITGRVAVTIVYAPKRGRGLDCGNCEKAALDGLKGIAWHDDSQVCMLQIFKHGAEPGGRFMVTIQKIVE